MTYFGLDGANAIINGTSVKRHCADQPLPSSVIVKIILVR